MWAKNRNLLYSLLKAIEHRSHNFIWCHFMDLDKEGHRNGPDSAEVMKKLSQTDKRVEKIAALCKKYGYSLILNSDHGQHLSPEKFIYGVHDGSCKEDLNALFLQLV